METTGARRSAVVLPARGADSQAGPRLGSDAQSEERAALLSIFLLVAALAAFSAGVLSGFTGFGHAAIVVPLLLLVYEPKTVVALAGVLSAAVAAAVVRDSWREADRRVTVALLGPDLPGLWVGAEAC